MHFYSNLTFVEGSSSVLSNEGGEVCVEQAAYWLRTVGLQLGGIGEKGQQNGVLYHKV